MPSAKALEMKKQAVETLRDKMEAAVTGVFVEYKGITVENDTTLRAKLREAGVDYKVVKNSIASRAANMLGFEALDEILVGTTALALCESDAVAPAKILSEYAKEHPEFQIKGGFLEGKVVSVDEIKSIAELPSREILIATVLGGLNAPITGLVNVLNGNIRGLAVALNAIAEKKGA